MKKPTYLELAKMILEEEKKPLSSVEIWAVMKKKGFDKEINTRGKTPWCTIGAAIYVNMRDPKKSMFTKAGLGPRRFYLRSLPKGR